MNWPEAILIGLIALVYWGAGELPKLGQKMGTVLSNPRHRPRQRQEEQEDGAEWPVIGRWELLALIISVCALFVWWVRAL